MDWIRDTLQEFGRQIGMGQLEFNRHGLLQLSFPSGGFLAVEPSQPGAPEEVLVYMGRPVGHRAAGLLRTALTRAHAVDGGAPFVQVGLRGDGPDAALIALARLAERSFTPQTLSMTVQYLDRWLDEVQAEKTK